MVATKAAVYAGIWCAGIYIEMGVPVFMALIIYAMFTCGTGEKWSGETSAYSVFNDGNQLAGTMSAEQIDAQMRNGGHAPRKAAEYESNFIQNALRGWGGGSEASRRPTPSASDGAPRDDELRRRRAAAANAAQERFARSTGTVSNGSGS